MDIEKVRYISLIYPTETSLRKGLCWSICSQITGVGYFLLL